MRSSALLPRRRDGACSPRTHRIASTTLDLPHPFGPTTAVSPGAKLIEVGSKKDLKPTTSRLLRRMRPSPPPQPPPVLHRRASTTALFSQLPRVIPLDQASQNSVSTSAA